MVFSGTLTTPASNPSKFDVKVHAANSSTVAEFIEALNLNSDEIADLESSTRGQSENDKWKEARKGRLTASNFYSIHTRMESLKLKPKTDMSRLIDTNIRPQDISHLPAIKHGKINEPHAIKVLMQQLKKSHSNARFYECGLFIDRHMPYIGASPDGIVECDCHGKILIEVKCITGSIDEASFLSDRQLKPRHKYYGQVQGQMMVTGILATHFFVFVSESETMLNTVTHDKEFCKNMRSNLSAFFTQYIAPKLLDEPVPKKIKL